MTKRTGPTNMQMQDLISQLRKKSLELDIGIWSRIAFDLEKPTRKRRIVNVYKLDKYTKDNELVIVPGKVLSAGEINHKVNVAAFNFSEKAKEKILKANGTCLSISELLKQNPKGQKIRIIG